MKKKLMIGTAAATVVLAAILVLTKVSGAGKRPARHAAPDAAVAAGSTEASLFVVEKKHFTDAIENLVGTIKGNTIELTFNGQEERLVAIHFPVGRTVHKGDCLFELDHTKAEARMTQADSAFRRAKDLQEAGGATQHDVDEAKSVYAMAKKDYDDTFIYAPKAGQVSQINRQVGETLGRSDVIGVLVSAEDRLMLETGVIESQLERLAQGQKAIVEIEALGGQKIEGHVAGISREVSTTGRTGTVVIALPDELQRRLRPGLSARCDIRTIDKDALVIPRQAFDKEKGGVYRVDAAGKVSLAPIELGSVSRDYYEVASGLEDGDRIVSDLTQSPVKDGATVSPMGDLARYEPPAGAGSAVR